MKNIDVLIAELKEIPEFRDFFSPQPIEDLVESYKTFGQLVPIHVSEDLEIINGYQMVDAIKMAGGKTVMAQIIDGKPDIHLRITLNLYRQKTTEDEIRVTREVFKIYPKRQGQRCTDEEPYERAKKISAALNGKWKNDVIQNKLEYILNNDLENDVLSKGIVGKGWKVDTCHDFLKEKMNVDVEKQYGFIHKLMDGTYSVAEVNKFIDQRLALDTKHQYTFVIPERANFYQMDCVKLAEMATYASKVGLIFTSIPYWDLRNYENGQERQLGQEETKEEYAANVAAIFNKLVPILKESANVVINVGETYKDGVAQGIPFLIRDYISKNTSLIYKDTLIWSKKNPRPQGEKVKRPVNSIEYLLWFVVDPVQAKYTMLTFPVQGKEARINGGCKDVASNGKVSKKSKSVSKDYGKLMSHIYEQNVENIIITSVGKNHDIFKISEEGHPAPMSPMLPVTLILMLSDEGDLVCDPFGGSNVVGKCALLLNRRYLGAELSKEYFNIGCEMLLLGNQNFDREGLNLINGMVNHNCENDGQEGEYQKAA
jgi:DNA modification methylase